MKQSVIMFLLICSFLPSFSQKCYTIFELGQKALDKENYMLALETFNRAISCDSSLAVAYNSRGFTKLYLGKYDEALQDLYKCMGIDSTNYQANYNIGCIYNELKEWEKVIEVTNSAIQIYDRYANAYNLRGVSRECLGDTVGALSDFNTAINCNPKSSMFYDNRASLYYKMGSVDKALEDYLIAIKLDPRCESCLEEVAYILTNKRRYSDSRVFCKKALKLNPNSPDILNQLAYNEELLGKYDDAFKHVQKALSIDSTHVYAWSTLAELQGLKGNKELFYKSMKIAVSLGYKPSSEALDLEPYKNFASDQEFKDIFAPK